MTVETLDITKDHCPMTFVKAKLALAKISSGDVLEVTLSGGEPLENVPKSAQEEGHKIISIEESGDNYLIKIAKK
ncbi:MAG: sulfurtransferase TusA family protein [Spirochaetia bacterium]|jgi:TusA-related sulfurtransferase|nr:sulfurtransferase TusA family protein [Spirochaetia bacterium]